MFINNFTNRTKRKIGIDSVKVTKIKKQRLKLILLK